MLGSKLAGVLAGGFAGALALVIAGMGAAQQEAPVGVFTPPRVVVAVFSAGGPVDRVLLLFDHEVEQEAVEERLGKLGELCGSAAQDPEITHDPFVSRWQAEVDREAGREESIPTTQTTVRFEMGGITDWEKGSLAVAPFVQVFGEDLPLRLVYNVGEEFPFSQPAEEAFRVDGARVRHFASAGSHQFYVMPAVPAPPPPPPMPSMAASDSTRRWMGVLVGLGIAIVVTLIALIGLIAYGAHTAGQHGVRRRKDREGGRVVTLKCSAGQGESET